MSVSASDIKIYGSANRPESDGVTSGGTIDTTCRYVFDSSTFANTLNDTVNMKSDQAGDNCVVALVGRNSTGVQVSGTYTLSGATPQLGAVTFERILKLKVLSGTHNGNITASGNAAPYTVLCTVESGVSEIRRAFYDVAADAAGGSSRDFYEKVFIKNTNTTNALLSAQVSESGDPTGFITFDLENAQNGSNSIASRLNTVPAGMLGSFDNSTKNVPGTNLLPGSGIAAWLRMQLPAGTAASKSTYTLGVTGSTI